MLVAARTPATVATGRTAAAVTAVTGTTRTEVSSRSMPTVKVSPTMVPVPMPRSAIAVKGKFRESARTIRDGAGLSLRAGRRAQTS